MEVSIEREFERNFQAKFITLPGELEKASSAPYLVSPVISRMGKKAIGLIKAECDEDVLNVIRLCNRYRIPLVARGNGTSTIGQVIPLRESIVIDVNQLNKEISANDTSIRLSPGVRVKDALNYLRKRGKELRVYPSSFYISTIGGYVAGGDVGIGSYQYGYYFDNHGVLRATVAGVNGKEELSGSKVLGIAQAAGANGIVLSVDLPIIDVEEWRDQILSFDSLHDVVNFLKNAENFREKIRRITIEDFATLSIVSGGRVNELKEWNVIVASVLDFGREVELKFLDELAFAAIYVTLSRLTKFTQYFYEVRLLNLPSFLSVVSQVKKALGNSVLIHGDVMTLRKETVVYTVFVSERNNFPLIDEIMRKEGIPFEIHSVEVNDRVDEPWRLELMKSLKKELDPHDIFNPGKLRI
ncbi:FAD-binding oxidoreductase [Sulfolobales archaeon HS-7]|nr:FAD-binding oxidoreductase [Sulfolobales archaeon HS-7]